MCGFVGYIDLRSERRADKAVVVKMANAVAHRGPDSSGYFVEENVGLGFRRLSIIDLDSGDQPLFNEDNSIVLMCNGEIFNYRELAEKLRQSGHRFRTKSDVEVLPHLYEEQGVDFLNDLNGQFAFVIYDRSERTLFLARDHFGINPLFYTLTDGVFIFASEIKAILEHPLARREVDLVGLDQVLSFPSLVSPRTMFKGIQSLKSGHFITIKNGDVRIREYWDLDYPMLDDVVYDKPEGYYCEGLKEHFANAVRMRLQSDVPVGFYLSGGLDSSMIAAMIRRVSPEIRRHSFSIAFADKAICESRYQKMMSGHTDSIHHEISFDWSSIAERLSRTVYHSECPLKETYNTASLALSECARQSGVPVVLNGEGSDELFAGYAGYRFDQFRASNTNRHDLDSILEGEERERLWGDSDLFYEKDQQAFKEIKAALYSESISDFLNESSYLDSALINKARVRGRHFIHQRSYLDFKMRLSGHLIADHGDRMTMANSVEARYPFLDADLVEFVRLMPPDLKLNQFTEKYILKKAAGGLVPDEIIQREKFAFVGPGSPYLLRQKIEWVSDLLSFDTIKRQGYFNPDSIQALKEQYLRPGYKLNIPLDDDLLIVVLTFGLLLEAFSLPSLN